MLDVPDYGVLAVARDTPCYLLAQIIENFVFQRKKPRVSHIIRVQHGVLSKEQLAGFLVLLSAEQFMAQLGLLFLAYFSVGF
jgi:hypothetical protein